MKEKIRVLFIVPLLLFLLGCSNLLINSSKNNINFSLDNNSVEYITRSILSNRSFSDDSLLKVEASLLKGNKVALHEVKESSLNNMQNLSFSFIALPYGEYTVEIKVSYNGVTLFSGTSSLIDITIDIPNPSIVVNLVKSYSQITYETNGGILSPSAPTTYFNGSNIELPSPTRGEDKFLGWYLEDDFSGDRITTVGIDSITGDVSLYASWEKAVTLTITPENGEIHFPDKIIITSNDPTAVIKYTTDGSDPLVSPTAKTFQKDFEGIVIDNNTIIKAAIEGTEIKTEKEFTFLYSIRFSLNGHGTSNPLHIQYLPYGSPIEDPGIPTAEGYNFEGWWDTTNCDQNEIHLEGLTVKASKIFHAKWVQTP